MLLQTPPAPQSSPLTTQHACRVMEPQGVPAALSACDGRPRLSLVLIFQATILPNMRACFSNNRKQVWVSLTSLQYDMLVTPLLGDFKKSDSFLSPGSR